MTELSPAAQAVVNAAVDVTGYGKETQLLKDRLAATLEAVADQVVPEEELPVHARYTSHWYKVIQRAETRSKILAIAAELRGTTTTTETP